MAGLNFHRVHVPDPHLLFIKADRAIAPTAGLNTYLELLRLRPPKRSLALPLRCCATLSRQSAHVPDSSQPSIGETFRLSADRSAYRILATSMHCAPMASPLRVGPISANPVHAHQTRHSGNSVVSRAPRPRVIVTEAGNAGVAQGCQNQCQLR
jgi:hypothetical protein